MECPYAALDFSPGLFDFFGPESAGYLYGSWEFGSGEPKTTSTPKPEPTTTEVKPTSTWTPELTTSSTTTKKTSTSTSTHSLTTSSSVASTTLSTSSTTVTPSSTAITVPTDVFGQLDLVMSNLGAILIEGVLVGAGGQ
ncbi:hypothetical protein C0995_007916 [Termitomyces sp. Mi166|nr:hypothetical protein C0995_007916 [Termitomyces sp. Mi166\